MLKPTRKSASQTEVEEGKTEAQKDLIYRYPIYVNKYLMRQYIKICRNRDTSASKEIVAFIERQVNARGGILDD